MPSFLSMPLIRRCSIVSFFFFNDTATTEIYTLSLHDALPICPIVILAGWLGKAISGAWMAVAHTAGYAARADRKSTRLNSSHLVISYAVFCLKKKKNKHTIRHLFLVYSELLTQTA